MSLATVSQPRLRLACMEMRGGSGTADDSFAMPGIDVWVYSKPFHGGHRGGDVHFVSTCATGRVARVLVADVAGHGDGVAEVAEVLRGLMGKFVNFIDQRKFFVAMNRRFADVAHGGMFATAVVLTYFAPTRTLSVSSAGHPPPLLWRGRERRWSYLHDDPRPPTIPARPSNVPLGVIDEARYDRFDLPLGEQDLVVCYTDSLTEARDTDGELLSMAGLLRVAETVDGDSPETVIVQFLERLAALHDGNLAGDDVTLLAFRPNGGSERLAWRRRLAAPARVLGGVLAGLLGGVAGGRRGVAPWPELSLANIGGAILHPLNAFARTRRH